MNRKIYYNGRIYTAEAENATAMVIENGKFVYVGTDQKALEYGDGIDLKGQCVIPGLIDSHCHLTNGFFIDENKFIFFDEEINIKEFSKQLKAIKSSEAYGDNSQVLAMGINLSKTKITAKDIDKIIDEKPVFVFSFDGHALVLNSCAMELVGINRDTKDPEGGQFERFENGEPNGVVVEIPALLICQPYIDMKPAKNVVLRNKKIIEGIYNYYGFTSVFDASTVCSENTEILDLLCDKSLKDQQTLNYFTSFCYREADDMNVEKALKLMNEQKAKYTTESVFPTTLKLIEDGTVEEHTASLNKPYNDQPENSGTSFFTTDEIVKIAKPFTDEGYNIHIHAIGDKATDNVIFAYDKLGNIKGTKTIAHNQLFSSEGMEALLKNKDIFFQTTPAWVMTDPYTKDYLGEDLYNNQFPLGTASKSGIKIAFGCDTVANETVQNPFLGMYCATTRGNDETTFPTQDQQITLEEAFYGYTINGARLLGADSFIGSIKEGKNADFVIIDKDLFECSQEQLKEINVIKTFYNGKEIYSKEE